MARLSLTHHLIRCERENGLDPDLRLLLEVIARAVKAISHAVGKGALGGVLGHAGTTNVQGEAQKKLDVLSNEIMVEGNSWGGYLAGMASEEMDGPVGIPVAYPRGKYLPLYDPLDGSSNIDVNVSVGTIFSVLKCPDGVTEPDESAFLQLGTAQVCAGYAVYGPQTLLMLTIGHGVEGRSLERAPAAVAEGRLRAAVQDLSYTAVRRRALSERVIATLAQRPPAAEVAALLAVALPQLLADRHADYAVVDQAVNAARANRSTAPAAGFINALLRNFLRQREELVARLLHGRGPFQRAPLVDRCGPGRRACAWQEILAAQCGAPPLVLRVNSSRSSVEDYLRGLAENDIAATRVGVPIRLGLHGIT